MITAEAKCSGIPAVRRKLLEGYCEIYNHRTNKRYQYFPSVKYVVGDLNSVRKAENIAIDKINNRITNEQVFIGTLVIQGKVYKDLLKVRKTKFTSYSM